MELEFDFSKGGSYWREMLIVSSLVVLLALGVLGWSVSNVDASGQAQILSWTDYQVSKAEKAYLAEREILRADADVLAQFLAQPNPPSPVAVQIRVNQILADTASGIPELVEARAALSNSALLVRDWAIGSADKDTAISSVQELFQLLAD